MGILVTVLPVVNTARNNGLVAATQVDLDSIKTAMGMLYNDTGLYPNGAASYCRSTATLPGNNEADPSRTASSLTANGNSILGWRGPYFSGGIDKWVASYFLDEDYRCFASTTGCKGITDSGNDSSVIVSCGPNRVVANGSCDYDDDNNIVYRLCN